MTKKIFDKAPNVISKTYQGVKQVGSDALYAGGKILEKSVKGICLILASGTEFTTDNVMNAVRQVAFNKTGSIEYSKQNIDMVELKKQGSVSAINENVTADVMQYFDKYCKQFDVKYNAMINERDPKNPTYMIFFNGKDDKVIEKVLRESFADYVQAQQRKKNGKEQGKEKAKNKSRNRETKKESVRAKLAFFRNRVADRDKEQGDVERNHRRSERQR